VSRHHPTTPAESVKAVKPIPRLPALPTRRRRLGEEDPQRGSEAGVVLDAQVTTT